MKRTDAQKAQNWKTGNDRPMCGNCRNVDVDYAERYIETAHYTCKKGQFKTAKTAICDFFEGSIWISGSF